MKILIPTAKELNAKVESVEKVEFSELTKGIILEFSKKSVEQLAKIYKIKEEKAYDEYERWQSIASGDATFYPALDLFNGLMYRNIKKEDFTAEDREYVKKYLYITTSLYGVINAYTAINKHRLDFLQNIKINNKSLKTLWKEEYNKSIANDNLVISLLSSEFEEVFSKQLRDNFLKIKFMEEKDGKLKVHSTISKKARGKFLTELVKRKVEDVESIKEIEFDSFEYSANHSTENELVFIAKR